MNQPAMRMTLDAMLRGVPYASPTPVEEFVRTGVAPYRGDLALPALTLADEALAGNIDLYFRYI